MADGARYDGFPNADAYLESITPKPSVFVLDDEKKNYKMIIEELKEKLGGLTATTEEELNEVLSRADIIKNDPQKAQELFAKLFRMKKLKAVIVDYDLGVGGLKWTEVLQQIKKYIEDYNEKKPVYIGTSWDPQTEEKFKEVGIDMFIPKRNLYNIWNILLNVLQERTSQHTKQQHLIDT